MNGIGQKLILPNTLEAIYTANKLKSVKKNCISNFLAYPYPIPAACHRTSIDLR